MKQKLTAIVIVMLTIITSNAQNVGIGTTTPLAQLSVGNNSQFQVNSTGNLIRINSVAYSFPAVQGAANQILKNDGSGGLTWSAVPAAPAVPKPVVRIFNLNGDGFSWVIDNAADYVAGDNTNPTLTLYRGFTYQFNVIAPGHPFRISTTNTFPGTPFTVNGVPTPDVVDAVLTFTVPMDAPSTLYYFCTIHPSMTGTINIQ